MALLKSHSCIFQGGSQPFFFVPAKYLNQGPDSEEYLWAKDLNVVVLWFFRNWSSQMVENCRLVNYVFLAWSMINVSTYHYYQKMPSSWPLVFLSIHLLFLVACCIASHSQVVLGPIPRPFINLSTFFPLLEFVIWSSLGKCQKSPHSIMPRAPGTRRFRHVWLWWPGGTGGNDHSTSGVGGRGGFGWGWLPGWLSAFEKSKRLGVTGGNGQKTRDFLCFFFAVANLWREIHIWFF